MNPLLASHPTDHINISYKTSDLWTIEGGRPVCLKCPQAFTLLQWAVMRGFRPLARMLVVQHPDMINQRAFRGQTALHCAAANNEIALMELLINRGAQIEDQDTLGWTPLHMAARRGHLEAVRCLVMHDANINAVDKNKKTPILLAADDWSFSYATITYLLPVSDLTHSDAEGVSVLDHIIQLEKKMLGPNSCLLKTRQVWKEQVERSLSAVGLDIFPLVLVELIVTLAGFSPVTLSASG